MIVRTEETLVTFSGPRRNSALFAPASKKKPVEDDHENDDSPCGPRCFRPSLKCDLEVFQAKRVDSLLIKRVIDTFLHRLEHSRLPHLPHLAQRAARRSLVALLIQTSTPLIPMCLRLDHD
jgi:hypothetical protein